MSIMDEMEEAAMAAYERKLDEPFDGQAFTDAMRRATMEWQIQRQNFLSNQQQPTLPHIYTDTTPAGTTSSNSFYGLPPTPEALAEASRKAAERQQHWLSVENVQRLERELKRERREARWGMIICLVTLPLANVGAFVLLKALFS